MIYTWYWTMMASIGLYGAYRNFRDRSANINALHTRKLPDGELKVAKVFRTSEFFRVSQTLIMLMVGLLVLYVRYFPKAWMATWVATHFDTITSIGLCAMATLLTINIWYFGSMGRRLISGGKHRRGE